jgi:UDP-GlcNAc:undecaprenyl-phosphate/decaprenyl-phosphate GlcNAc-1-phosphate transferase
MNTWLLAFFISFVSATIATRFVMALGIADIPDEARKNHTRVTPTAGGLGIIVGLVAGLIFAAWQSELNVNKPLFATLALSLAGGALGLRDDISALGSKVKLAIMLLCTLGFVVLGSRIETLSLTSDFAITLGPFVGALGTIFWLLVIVNTVNFMDGANGMAMGCAALGLFGLCALSVMRLVTGAAEGDDFALIAWVGMAACLGFLVWNAWKGTIFAGDCGALFIGLLCGGLGVLAVVSGINPLCVAMCFLPMLVDVILTVVRRLRKGDNVLSAHSEHAYQKVIRAGASHLYTSGRYWMQTVFTIMCALLAQNRGGWWPLGLFIGATVFLSFIYIASLRDAARVMAARDIKG